MFRHFIAYLVSIAMIGSGILPRPAFAGSDYVAGNDVEADFLTKYPGATVIRVSAEAYPALRQKLAAQGYIESRTLPVNLAENGVQVKAAETKPLRRQTAVDDECAGAGLESAGDESLRVMVDFTEDMVSSSNGTSGDEAAVVFVVVGTVVLVVWTLYIFKYFYDVSMGFRPCGRWKELTLVNSAIRDSGTQRARFDGLRLSAGFRDGATEVGISLELGEADILLSEVSVLELEGRYWFLGPVLRWRLSESANPSYFHMNFVAGTTQHGAVGLMAKASLGLLFGIGESFQLGLNWGVLNIKLDEDQGIISDRSQYHYLYGVNAGFRF